MEGVYMLDGHPLVGSWLTKLRDQRIGPREFRETLRLITWPLVLRAVSDLQTEPTRLRTPMGMADGCWLCEPVGVAAILRAALGMVETIQQILPASVYHIDMHRNEETLQPEWARDNLPGDCSGICWLIPDPMLATGRSAIATVDALKERGARNIRFIGVIAAPEGVAALTTAHPDVPVFVAAVDAYLTNGSDGRPRGYIVPGLGDAGDRQFGT